MIAAIIVLLALAIGFFRPGNTLLFIAMALCSFGTLAIIPPDMIGGTTVLASAVAFLLLVGRQALIAGQAERMVVALIDVRRMGLLGLFGLVAVVGAFTLPRIFQGQIMVYPMRAAGLVSYVVPLAPTSSNFNQALNQIEALGVAVSIYAMARWSGFSQKLGTALLWGGAAVVFTGLLDMIGTAAGLDVVLEQFRTASYVLMDGSDVNGVRRVIGMMSEASSFGALSTSFGSLLFFTRNAYSPRARKLYVYPISIACLVFALLSTASTAYGALAVFGLLNVVDILWRSVFAPKAQKVVLFYELLGCLAVFLIGASIFLSSPELRQMVKDMLDAIVFNKTQSSSYLERSAWTAQGMTAFRESHGIGVGAGAARTSNFFVNILASTGILGGVLFAAFLVRVFAARIPSSDRQAFELAHGAKLAILVAFVSMYLSGTTPDYGVFLAVMFGLIVGLATRKGRVRNQSNTAAAVSDDGSEEDMPQRKRPSSRVGRL